MSGRRKAQILEVKKNNAGKPLPAILSRKRKNDEDPMQPVSFLLGRKNFLLTFYLFRISTATSVQWTKKLTMMKTSKEFLSQIFRFHAPQHLGKLCLRNISNFHGIFFPSRVPLATLSLSSDNIVKAEPSPDPDMGYALKLPGRHHSEPISSLVSSPSTPSSSISGATLSPNSQKENRRKQTLSWKRPRMRDSWSQWVLFPFPTPLVLNE